MNCTKCKSKIEKGQLYHRTKKGSHHADCTQASRVSRSLSAVPSEEEIEAWYIEKYGVARDLNGKPSWNSQFVGYRTDGDLYEMLNDFVKWIKQRGIAG